MSYDNKCHKKLRNPKHATVSLDSLLGLLSSAYGTEKLNSNLLFDKSNVSWLHLSAEHLQPVHNTIKSDKDKNVKATEKISVTTSTTNLKSKNKIDGAGETDLTLVSIKSLEALKNAEISSSNCVGDFQAQKQNEIDSITEDLSDSLNNKMTLKPSSSETLMNSGEYNSCSNEHEEATGLKYENVDIILHEPVCSLIVNSCDNKIALDIRFTKKRKENENKICEIQQPEILINVTDLVKQTKTCLTVEKKSLVSKAHYFACIEKDYGLESLNIAVKCNLSVLQWILQWIRADIFMCKPNLNSSNLKPVLFMANHLKIDELVQECLDYFHKNYKSILETDWDIEDILDDELFVKMTILFSVDEIDAINEYFDSFKSKMYCTLIRYLVNPDTSQFHSNQFNSLANIFQCSLCEKLLHHNIAQFVYCRSDYNELSHTGALVPLHERSPRWDLSHYIELINEDLGSWKAVYWKLWGLCHFVKCSVCKSFYPLNQSNWCPYHPESVEYFQLNSDICYPIGTYKCCSEIAFKFNVLNQHGGCQFRDHKPELCLEKGIEMFNVYHKYKHYICSQPPKTAIAKKFFRLVQKSESEMLRKESLPFWWEGVRLAPKEKKDYSIIPHKLLRHLRNKPQTKKPEQVCNAIAYKPSVPMGLVPSSTTCLNPPNLLEKNYSSDNIYSSTIKKKKIKGGCSKKIKPLNSTSPSRIKIKKKITPIAYKPIEHIWMNTELNKDNQDNQREFEEIAMRKLIHVLSSDITSPECSEPTAGSYIQLEAKWWQEHCSEGKIAPSKSIGTVVNRTFPLSWFRRLTI